MMLQSHPQVLQEQTSKTPKADIEMVLEKKRKQLQEKKTSVVASNFVCVSIF